MLSYQHAFHAGNHADILKHYVLFFVLNYLNKKDKAYTMFDTHSGSGLYDLFDNRIVKTGEAEKGILGLFNLIKNSGSEPPEEMNDYLKLVKEYLDRNLYPGSPEIERRLLRCNDTLVLSELHPQEIINLKENMKNPRVGTFSGGNKLNDYPDIKIHNRNGWEMIKALTPPVTKRGAVLIDPSYEETEDYINAGKTICQINKKWSNGIIMLWYPLLSHRESEIENMVNSIVDSAKSVNKNVDVDNLTMEVYEKDREDMSRLYGSGMLVINSPWKLNKSAEIVIKYVENLLSPLYK